MFSTFTLFCNLQKSFHLTKLKTLLYIQLTNPHSSFPLPLGNHPFCFLFKNLTTIGCCCLVTKLCPTLCDPLDCSTPGFSVLHCLLEFAQTHAIQRSHPVSSPSPPAFNLSQGTYGLKSEGLEKIFHANGNQKKAGVAVLTSDKKDFKIKIITSDNKLKDPCSLEEKLWQICAVL